MEEVVPVGLDGDCRRGGKVILMREIDHWSFVIEGYIGYEVNCIKSGKRYCHSCEPVGFVVLVEVCEGDIFHEILF